MGVNTLAVARARIALDAAGLNPDVALTRASSVTNEVWLTPDLVVRVNSRLDHRLRREADLARMLPINVGYPPIVAYGGELGADWLILERVRGKALSRWWPDLSRESRRAAVAQLADKLRAVHSTAVPHLGELHEVPQLLDRARRGRVAVARLLDAPPNCAPLRTSIPTSSIRRSISFHPTPTTSIPSIPRRSSTVT